MELGKTEKQGLAAAAVAMGGLLVMLLATSPDVPDTPPPGPRDTSEKILEISSGEEVTIASHLRAEGRTVVEFSAVW